MYYIFIVYHTKTYQYIIIKITVVNENMRHELLRFAMLMRSPGG